MNLHTTEGTNDGQVDEVASLWAARLEGATLSAADREALDAWLAENAAHRAALSRYCQFSADLEQQIGALAAAGLVEAPREAGKPERSFRGLGWLLAGSLAAAAVVVAFRLAPPSAPPAIVPGMEYVTAAGQRSTVSLADGSMVEMNAQTRLTFVNSASERRVHLASGEAFFSVAKLSPAVPFFVESPAGTIRVTGTHFAVRAEAASDLEVTVEEGSVEVIPSAASGGSAANARALQAGDRLIARNGSVAVEDLTPDELVRALKWREGIVSVVSTPLSEVAKRFEQFHNVRILVAPALAVRRIDITLDLAKLDTFFGSVDRVLGGVRVTQRPDGSFQLDPAP